MNIIRQFGFRIGILFALAITGADMFSYYVNSYNSRTTTSSLESGFNYCYEKNHSCFGNFNSAMYAVPRRTLPKRTRKKRKQENKNKEGVGDNDEDVFSITELRPIVSQKSVLAGEDYWIAEEDMQASLKREQQKAKARKASLLAGGKQIPQEKLRDEIAAPYKQNWIGFISVSIIILAVIGTQFPELLENPLIPNIPDVL